MGGKASSGAITSICCQKGKHEIHIALKQKNLEANLKNHLGGTKHEFSMKRENSLKSGGTALSTGKWDHVTRSTTTNSWSSSKNLHSWLQEILAVY